MFCLPVLYAFNHCVPPKIGSVKWKLSLKKHFRHLVFEFRQLVTFLACQFYAMQQLI